MAEGVHGDPQVHGDLMMCSAALYSYTCSISWRHGTVLWILLVATELADMFLHRVANRWWSQALSSSDSGYSKERWSQAVALQKSEICMVVPHASSVLAPVAQHDCGYEYAPTLLLALWAVHPVLAQAKIVLIVHMQSWAQNNLPVLGYAMVHPSYGRKSLGQHWWCWDLPPPRSAEALSKAGGTSGVMLSQEQARIWV